jgi:O-methyltransferase involved in polyketide biosynthesis
MASKFRSHYETISPTALAAARARTFSDIPYSKEIFDAAEKTMKISNAKKRLIFNDAPTYEARYKLVNKLLGISKITQIMELASGLSPRGISMAQDKKVKYVEIDLANIMAQKLKLLHLIKGNLPSNLHFETGNILNLKTLEVPAKRYFDKNEPIAMLNEGLMRYLNFEEKARLGRNIHSLLENFGGVWITPDITLREGVKKENVAKATQKVTGVNISQNAFESVDEAKQFFTRLGFDIEVHSFLEVKGLVSPMRLKLSTEATKEMIGQWVVFVMRC